MIKEFLEIGQIVGTHGVNGELRVNPWCDSPDFFKGFERLYFDENGVQAVKVVSCRPHGNIVLLCLEGVNGIDAAATLRGKVLFMCRKDAHLPEGRYFVSDLTGCKVIDADDESQSYHEALRELVLPMTEVLVGNQKTLTDFLLPEWDAERPPSARELAAAAHEHGRVGAGRELLVLQRRPPPCRGRCGDDVDAHVP